MKVLVNPCYTHVVVVESALSTIIVLSRVNSGTRGRDVILQINNNKGNKPQRRRGKRKRLFIK